MKQGVQEVGAKSSLWLEVVVSVFVLQIMCPQRSEKSCSRFVGGSSSQRRKKDNQLLCKYYWPKHLLGIMVFSLLQELDCQ
jgi:hypothetical protein